MLTVLAFVILFLFATLLAGMVVSVLSVLYTLLFVDELSYAYEKWFGALLFIMMFSSFSLIVVLTSIIFVTTLKLIM